MTSARYSRANLPHESGQPHLRLSLNLACATEDGRGITPVLFKLGSETRRVVGRSDAAGGATTPMPAATSSEDDQPPHHLTEVEFEDGSSSRIPTTWVSAPIDAGFFLYAVPAAHSAKGHCPEAVTLRDGDGAAVERASLPFGPRLMPSSG